MFTVAGTSAPTFFMLIQTALQQPYRRETWTTLLRDLFPEDSLKFLAVPAPIDAEHDSITSTLQLGTLQLGTLQLNDGSRIALIEVEASDSVQLALNRIALRNFIGKHIVPEAWIKTPLQD